MPVEHAVLQRHWWQVRKLAGHVLYPHRLSMGREDVEQDLQVVLLIAARKFYWEPGGLLPSQLASVIIQRRTGVLIRNSTRANRDKLVSLDTGGAEDGPLELPSPIRGVDEGMAAREAEAPLVEAVYRLRHALAPTEWAVLYLRHCEELDKKAIVAATGLTPTAVKQRLYLAKVRAAAFLRSMGIDTWEDLDDDPS